MSDLFSDDAKRAKEGTEGAQKFLRGQQEERNRQHRQILEMEIGRLNGEILRVQKDHDALILEEEGIKRKEAEAKQILERTVTKKARGKTESLDVVRTTKQLQNELAEFTQKKKTLTETLAELKRKEVAAKRAPASASLNKKDVAKAGELTRRLGKLKSDIETLTSDIVTDEARLKKEKETFVREGAKLKLLQQELVQTESNSMKPDVGAAQSVQQERRVQQEEEQTKMLLRNLESTIQEDTKKLKDVTSRGEGQKTEAQTSSREELTAQQTLHVAQQKLLDRNRRIKIFDAELSIKKDLKAKKEAEFRKAA